MSASLKNLQMKRLCRKLFSRRFDNQNLTTCISSLSTSSGERKPQSSTDYCMDLVRRHDYEGFLCSLLYPTFIRNASFAIRAFNVETAQIEDSVREKLAGMGRMKFWKDLIDKVYEDDPPQTPVAVELAAILRRHRLTKRWFHRILEARADKVQNSRYGTINDMEEYSENTMSSLMYLHLECLGIKNIKIEHAASHLGKAQGLVTLLRAAPYIGKSGKVYLPLDLMAKHKVSQEDVLRGRKQQEICDIVYEIACVVMEHLDKSKSFGESLHPSAAPLFIHSIIIERYLKKLEKAGFFIYHPSLQKKDGLLPMKLWIQKIRKTH